jgi:hypothetical protein
MALAKAFAAGLATPPLDRFRNTLHTIAHQGMNRLIGDAMIHTHFVWTLLSFAVQFFGATAPARHLRPGRDFLWGMHVWVLTLALRTIFWRAGAHLPWAATRSYSYFIVFTQGMVVE